MPAKARRRPPKKGATTSTPSAPRASAGPSSTPTSALDSQRSVDELALTPLPLHGRSSQRGRSSINTRSTRTARHSSTRSEPSPVPSRGGRQTRAGKKKDREIVELQEGELVPPSDEEEYELWLEERKGRASASPVKEGKGKGKEREVVEVVTDKLEEAREERLGRPETTEQIATSTPIRLASRRTFQTLLPSPSTSPQTSISQPNTSIPSPRESLRSYLPSSPSSPTSQAIPASPSTRQRRYASSSRETSPTQPLTYVLGEDESLLSLPHVQVVSPVQGDEEGEGLSPDELDLLAQPGPSDWYLRKSQSQSPDQRKTTGPSLALSRRSVSAVPLANEREVEIPSLAMDVDVDGEGRMDVGLEMNGVAEQGGGSPDRDFKTMSPRTSLRPTLTPAKLPLSGTPQPLLHPQDSPHRLVLSPASLRTANFMSYSPALPALSLPTMDSAEPAQPQSPDPPPSSLSPRQSPSALNPLHSASHSTLVAPFSLLNDEAGQVNSLFGQMTPETVPLTLAVYSEDTQLPAVDQIDEVGDGPDVPSILAQSPPTRLGSHELAVRQDEPPASLPPADPVLEQFRTARTFRTRTVLQLQPYTKERQIYEATLRRGGLKKGKKAVAQAREITREEEDDEAEGEEGESSEASVEESTERIFIGDTPPAREKRPRKVRELIDADFDEYFVEHGVVADEEDEYVAKELQTIARNRVTAEKEERRRKREEERERHAFERFMNEVNGMNDAHPGEAQPARRPLEPRKTTGRTPKGTKTYASKDRHRRTAVRASSSEPDAPSRPQPLAPPILSTQSPARSVRAATGTPTASFRTARSFDVDVEMDVGYGQQSIFIDDLPLSPPRIRSPSPRSSQSESSLSTPEDPRQKIARRMMPAAMLKRLEAEAAAKEKRKQERKRREQRASPSPIRPGRAVVRRGAGNGVDNFDDIFSDGDSSDDTPVPLPGREKANSFDQPIVVDDDTDSSSEAAEDNQTERTLARLHRGDFEGIVAGNRWRPSAVRHRKESRTISRSSRARRPALGLTKRIRQPMSHGNKAMTQTRLDFPIKDRSPPARKADGGKKRKRKAHAQGGMQRPAIQLDDHVIFATADFEFDSQEDVRPQPPKVSKPRSFARTASNPSTVGSVTAGPDVLDAGIGKARSWANFDRFPIDFDITPLPSGLYCHEDTIPGSGRLRRLVRRVNGRPNVLETLEPTRQYDIELRSDMTPEVVLAVVPLIFDATLRQMVTIANDDSKEQLGTAPLDFLGRYLDARSNSIDESTTALRLIIIDQIQSISMKLDDVGVGEGRSARPARQARLKLAWSLFELNYRFGTANPDEGIPDALEDSAVALCRYLLSGGFDKTIRPLKLIMRGESDSAEISDLSITLWISLIHSLAAWDAKRKSSRSTFLLCLGRALDSSFHLDQTGPLAAERIWFLVFGLCAISQFDIDGRIASIFISSPRWQLVRRAVGLIKVAFDEDAEKRAQRDQLQGRDRYIKAMMARCVRLSAVWRWSFDRESFSVATRDLGVIFKDRQYRNLPTEPPVDYPDFITRFDMSLTAAEDTKRETAFELYLRLVCVAASDIIGAASSLLEAQQAEKDVQRLVMSIIPVSAVKFNRLFPPTPRELGQLINRYSTMIAACHFSPSLLNYLLANCRKWSPFEQADFDSRQICIRGLMYLAVACRHHRQPLVPVVNRLAEILKILQIELETHDKPSAVVPSTTALNTPSRVEIARTMVLVVTCFRQIIKHHSYDVEEQKKAVYPDPHLLHESWTTRIFDLDLTQDLQCGLEVISTIQTFLDTRSSTLPRLAKQRREAKEKESHPSESLDEFGSLGIDFTAEDVLALGGQVGEDPVEKLDKEFAEIIENVLSPRIYRLLSDILPPVTDSNKDPERLTAERQIFISRLTKCWSDCASVLVVEHQSLDWSTFISPFGRQSWARLGDEKGRVQVGLQFMLNIAQLDSGAFIHHEEDFVALFFQIIGTDKLSVEHRYVACMLAMQGALDHPLLSPLREVETLDDREMTRERFMEVRGEVLRAIFISIPDTLRSRETTTTTKSFIYRCMNLFVSSLVSYDKSIPPTKVLHKESYLAFVRTTLRDLSRTAGEYITPMSVPALKYFAGTFR